MTTQDMSERQNLVEAIKTPLGFFSVTILVVEALFGGLALASSGADRTFLLYSIVGILVLLVLLVAVIAVWRPEALWGKRYSALEESFATGLGEEIYQALDGHLANLEELAREQAYELLRVTITTSPYARSRPTRRFCQVLVGAIIRRAELRGQWRETIGIMAQ
jgi:hypothetical protein